MKFEEKKSKMYWCAIISLIFGVFGVIVIIQWDGLYTLVAIPFLISSVVYLYFSWKNLPPVCNLCLNLVESVTNIEGLTLNNKKDAKLCYNCLCAIHKNRINHNIKVVNKSEIKYNYQKFGISELPTTILPSVSECHSVLIFKDIKSEFGFFDWLNSEVHNGIPSPDLAKKIKQKIDKLNDQSKYLFENRMKHKMPMTEQERMNERIVNELKEILSYTGSEGLNEI